MMGDFFEQDYRHAKRPRWASSSSDSEDGWCLRCSGWCSGGCESTSIDHDLRYAVSNLQVDLAKATIARGASVNTVDPMGGETLLTTVCKLKPAATRKSMHVDVINALIQNGASVNLRNSKEQTPLHVASTTEAVKVLLQNGASVYEQNERGETPLFVACRFKRPLDLISALLEAGALNAPNARWGKRSPLHFASHSTVKLLLQNGASADGVGEDEPPLFTFCKKRACPYDMITTLLEHGAFINFKTSSGRTPLHAASSNGVAETVQFLIQKGASVNEVDKEGESPLFMAAKKPAVTDDVINVLLMNGALINMKNRKGRTPLHVSRCSAKVLLQKGAAVNEADYFGESPLFMACRGKSWYDNASPLLQYGASVNMKNSKGDTPLHLACSNLLKDMVSLLLCNGASVNEVNNEGESPIFLVFKKIKKDACPGALVAVLLEHGALIEKKDHGGQTPLHVACSRWAKIDYLLQRGASVSETDILGRTPLELANYDACKILLDYGAAHCMLRPPLCLGKDCRFSSQHFCISNHIAKVGAAVSAVHYDPMLDSELAAMKAAMIGRSTVSFCDLLHLNILRSDYEEVLSSVTPQLLKASFPQLSNRIYCSYLKIKKICLMDECCSFFSLTCSPSLPPEVVYEVLKNLSVADLVVLLPVIRPAPSSKVYEHI